MRQMSHFVYSEKYNISLYGLEKIHSFDTCKYMKIFEYLQEKGIQNIEKNVIEVSKEELWRIHTKEYIEKLESSCEVGDRCELEQMRFLPNFLVQKFILSPMRYQVKGTIMAGEIAMKNGWCVNIGGGMHHASSDDGGGWCLYSDIPLSINNLMVTKKISKAMIIDLDVHQGNGIERDLSKLPKKSVYMIDIYNHSLYPNDEVAKKAINIDIDVTEHTTDKKYLTSISSAIKKGLRSFKPDIVFYNAGTDILDGDPLNGGVSITKEGVIKRDELVMKSFTDLDIPIVMVLSGGYSSESSNVISRSLHNLYKKLPE
jgi:histone deacetylase 11